MPGAPVSILYVGNPILAEQLSSQDGVTLRRYQDPADAAASARAARPDLVLLAPWGGQEIPACDQARAWRKMFETVAFRFMPGFCLIADQMPGPESRLDLLQHGVDWIMALPLLPGELIEIARIQGARTRAEQKFYSGEKALEKAFDYLDRFKAELAAAQKELADETHNLNAALRQVQQMTLERQRMKTSLATLRQTLSRNIDGFGRILERLIQTRVEVNRGHGRRVAGIACHIAKEMGLDEKKLEDLSKAAMLHEVGRLFLSGLPQDTAGGAFGPETPDPGDREAPAGRLESYDRNIMVQYPVKGAELLRTCPGFEGAAQILMHLNENADGTGFPDGLKKRHIPLAARILAGADELDTLGDRKENTGTGAMIQALEELSGVRLDPVVAGALEKYAVQHLGNRDFPVRGVGLEQLSPGMELGCTLFTASGTKLFSANTVLTRASIEKIIQYSREYPVDEIVYIKV